MVYKESFKLESRHRAVSFHDITQQVKEIAARSNLKDGIVVVYSHHTTCSVITQECAFDMSMTGLETLQQDLVNCFEEWIPTCRYEGQYLHPLHRLGSDPRTHPYRPSHDHRRVIHKHNCWSALLIGENGL